ncbi:MAG: VUT family protein [Tatlockia sp.]|nr:VUT family protein [Tatlockia sp.]
MENLSSIYTTPREVSSYKYVHFFMMLFITIFIVCDITAFRMTTLFNTTVPVSGLIIPFVFSLGDLIAEIYGYSISRKLIWNALICQFVFGCAITLALKFPMISGDNVAISYNETFQHIIRTNITSCMSVSSGMFTNAFLISKLKIWMNGKRFWVRTILSSSISEFVLCFVAYTTLYVGLKSFTEIWNIVLSVWYYKLIFALFAAPIVAMLATVLKKIEKSDVFDHNVNYNPIYYNG